MKLRSIYIRVVSLLAVVWAAAVPEARGELRCRRYDFAATSQALQSHISNVQQDESGFMWFATWNGLVRFDGYNFHTFQPVALSDGMLESNRIYNLRVVSTGNLLCMSSDNHLSMFDRERFKFVDIQSLIPEVAHLRTRSMFLQKNGYVWMIFRDDTALRMSDSDPTGEYVVYPAGEGILAGCGRITGMSRTDPDDEWLLTRKAACNMTAGKRLEGNFHSMVSADGMVVGVMTDGNVKIYNRNLEPVGDTHLFGGRAAKISAVASVADRVYVGADCGLSAVEARSGAVVPFTGAAVRSIHRDRKHRVWCVLADGRVGLIERGARGEMKFPRLTGGEQRPADSRAADNSETRSLLIFTLSDGRVILQSPGVPLSVYDESTGMLEEIHMADGDGPVSISPESPIKKHMVDAADNLWVFHERGADCYSFSDNHFTHFANPSKRETRAMVHDSRGRLWIGERSKSISVSAGPGQLRRYLGPDGSLSEAPVSFCKADVYAMREDAEGNIWLATKGEGVYMLSRPRTGGGESFRVTHYSHTTPDSYLPTDTVYDLLPYRGKVWIGSYGGGLSRGEMQPDGTYRFEYVKGQPQGLKIRGLAVDEPGGVLMIATTEGLVTADISSREPHFYSNRYRPEPWGLKGNDVMEIIRSDGRYYVCVFGVGVSRIDTENLLSDSIRFTTYPLPTGAAAGQIRTAIAHGDDIWIMSDRTVTRFNTGTGLYATRFMGLGSERYVLSESDPVVWDGRIVAATSDGVAMFTPDNLVSDGTTSPLPVVTGIQYQNDPQVYPLNDLSELTVDPEHRSFTLFLSLMTFAPSSMTDADVATLRYRLENYDGGWNYSPGMQPAVNYNNLSPGRYKLIIETLNPDGSWSREPREIVVQVKAYLSETLLFRCLLAVLILVALGGMGFAVYSFRRMRDEIHRKYSLLMSVDNISSTHTPDHLAPPREGSREEKERRFLDETAEFIAANIDNPELVVEDLARNAGMSRTAYYTRLKQLTGLTPVDFIKQMRIKKALQLLEEGHLSVTEVAYGVGFSDPKYFSRCFKAEMGLTPSQYAENSRKN